MQEPYSFARVRAMHEAKAQQVDVFSARARKSSSPIGPRCSHRSTSTSSTDPAFRRAMERSECGRELHAGDGDLLQQEKVAGRDHPKSWADFWNVDKFPGRRAIRRTPPMWTIEAALLADGVKEENFYPLDVDRAFRSLDRIKPHVKVWWADNAQAQQFMEQEEVDLITMMNGRATESINNKAPYEIVWNEA